MSHVPENEKSKNTEPTVEDPLQGIEKEIPQTSFTLVSDHHSLQMYPEGFKVNQATQGDREDDVFPPEGGELYLSNEDYKTHLRSEFGTPKGAAALFAGHVAIATGESVIMDWDEVIERDDNNESVVRPAVAMPVGAYVERLRQDTAPIYEPQHANFNFAVQNLYAGGRVSMPPEMELSPENQLIAAHAARQVLEDDEQGKFPNRPPRLSPESVNQRLTAMEAGLSAQSANEFDEIVKNFDNPDGPKPL